MGDVIEFNSVRQNQEPEVESTLTGPAKCLACKHEWVAEAPIGDSIFDMVCPKCDTRRGQLVYPPELGEGMVSWEHRCGSSHFTPTCVDSTGRVAKTEDMALLNTAGREKFQLRFFCHGCGELVDPDTMT